MCLCNPKIRSPFCPNCAGEFRYIQIEGDKINSKKIKKAPIITICGSTRFKDDILNVQRKLTFEGWVVLSCPFFNHADGETLTEQQNILLDGLHRQKIDLSEAIFVVNKNGYIGLSTMSEITYATNTGKRIIFMEEHE